MEVIICRIVLVEICDNFLKFPRPNKLFIFQFNSIQYFIRVLRWLSSARQRVQSRTLVTCTKRSRTRTSTRKLSGRGAFSSCSSPLCSTPSSAASGTPLSLGRLASDFKCPDRGKGKGNFEVPFSRFPELFRARSRLYRSKQASKVVQSFSKKKEKKRRDPGMRVQLKYT